jgi:outer membrane protein TolC
LAVALAGALLLAGCSHTTSFTPAGAAARRCPRHGMPPSRRPSSRRRKTSRAGGSFGDAQLTALIDQALQANPSLLSAQAAVRQARATRDVQAAGLLPSAGASAGGAQPPGQ